MYLKKVLYKNVGPLDTLSIEMPFNDDGFPKPLIIVGENGSGKSTLLSNIVDSFYEIASIAFTDAQFSESAISYQYYKMISSDHIKVGNNSTVGAGAVVIRKVKDGDTVFGNPAKKIEF